jgi:hypothetical protein
MKDMMTVFVYKDGQDTNGRFQTDYKKFKSDDIITFYGHKYRVSSANQVVVIAEEVEE